MLTIPRTVDAERLVTSPNDGAPYARDFAKGGGAMELGRLERILDDIQNQPGWRAEADKACDYYDGKQLDAETVEKLRARGLGELSQNLIKPTIDAVLGLEAKTRTDWMVTCEDDRWQPVTDFMNAKIKEAERETRADRACSDAFAGQCKAGFHVVEVSRQTNPFEYPYRVLPVHRREIYWDWHSQHPTWDDARYVVRKRWHDADVVAAFFPQHADLIKHAARGWAGTWASTFDFDNRVHQLLVSGQELENRIRWDELEWRDTERNRVCVYEVWYRTYHRGAVLWLPDGRKVEYDSSNPMHVAVVASGKVVPRVGVFDRLRLSYFVGPHRLSDVATNRRRFPYIPFWGYREDLTGAPYGLIRSMLSPQDEVNARRAKMMWLLSAKRIVIDNDSLDEKYNTLSQASYELARADAFIVANANRQNKDGIRVDENMDLAEQQFKLLMEAKSAVQEAGGIYAAMMGQNSNATSGTAIQSLIEQGTMTLAEINDNYFHARRQVGEALMELIREDSRGPMEMMVNAGFAKKMVAVNQPRKDEATGLDYLENDVARAPIKMSLTDVPSTPTFRATQFTMLAEITKSLPPQLQAIVAPFIIESSELSRRKELASLMRKQLGIDIDPNSPEGQAALQAQAEQQQKIANLQMQEAMAKIREIESRAAKYQADAQKVLSEIGQGDPAASQAIEAEKQQLRDQINKLNGEIIVLKANQAGAITAAQIKGEADVEKARVAAEGNERIAQLEAEAEAEVARINAEAQAKIDAVMEQLDQITQQFAEKISALEQQSKEQAANTQRELEKRDAAAALQRAEDDKKRLEEQAARDEAERKKADEAEDKAEGEKDDTPAAPQPIVVVVPGEGGKKRKRRVTFQMGPDGGPAGATVEDDGEAE